MKKKWYKKYPLPPIFQISSPGLAEIFVNCLSRACFMYKISQLYMLLQAAKGQLISKCHFGVFNSPKKRTKTIRLEVYSSKFEFFRSFFGRFEDTKKTFRNQLTFKNLLS